MKTLLHSATQQLGGDWGIGVLVISAAIVSSSFLHFVVFTLIGRVRKRDVAQKPRWLIILYRLRQPARAIAIVSAVLFTLPFLPFETSILVLLGKMFGVLWFCSMGWLLIGFVYVFEDLLLARYDLHTENNLQARRIRTQTQVLRRLAISFIVIFVAGLSLSLFSSIWHYGAGLLASAGLASIALATAAKSTVSNVLAGIQIAMTEPIRIDDVVIVQGEWGRVEEITTSYVVIAIWDLRRLIVPLSYFIEQPFQNWTRNSAHLMGTAFLYVDYSVPVNALRKEFTAQLEASPLWDRKVCSLQVTNLSEHTLEIRCLLSARNSSEQFDLRCSIREKMVEFIMKNYPQAFPRMRFSALLENAPEPAQFPPPSH
jgi:small-conductance mechanosensitive channel